MRNLTFVFTLLAGMAGMSMVLVGCADDTDADATPGVFAEMIDSVAAAVAENIVDSQVARVRSTPTIELAVKRDYTETGLPPVNDLFFDGDFVWAAFNGGLLKYELGSGEYSVTPAEDNLRALAVHGDGIFVGGDRLYQLTDAGLAPVEDDVPGQINTLCSYGPSLMIGSTEGLFAHSILGCVSLLEDVAVTALVADNDGLWIGTDGQGVYRWDGEEYRERYLARDSSLFDYATALAFAHNHLYLGTPNGMFVFDGGRWETVSAEQGLPNDVITSIDAAGWVVYVGTPDGMVSWFNQEVNPVARMEGQAITSICRAGSRIIAGTDEHGLVIKAGPSIKTLVEPWKTGASELASTTQ